MNSTQITPDELRHYFTQNKGKIISELKEFISYASVSAEPQSHQKCLDCAEWVKGYLKNTVKLDNVEMISTTGLPLVYGEKIIPGAKKTVLIYGHYDVQPTEGQAGWTVAPYDGVEKDGYIVARGAVDNKGQLLYVLKGLQALIEKDAQEFSVKVVVEGEEESGSNGLAAVLDKISSKIKADTLVVADMGSVKQDEASLSMSLRGIVAIDVHIKGPAVDCHSGVFGGIIPNPAQALAKIAASLHDENGKIAVKGFYDDVLLPSAEEIKSLDASKHELGGIVSALKIELLGGETDYPPEVRRSFRPTLEINGICSGYYGPGSKTIIPAEGTLKITCRTVPNQEPKKIANLVIDHLKRVCPKPFVLTATSDHFGDWIRGDLESKSVKAALDAGKLIYEGRSPTILWEGASVPILPAIQKAAKAEAIMIGLCTVTNGMHSPDENFGIHQLEAGVIYVGTLLQVLAKS